MPVQMKLSAHRLALSVALSLVNYPDLKAVASPVVSLKVICLAAYSPTGCAVTKPRSVSTTETIQIISFDMNHQSIAEFKLKKLNSMAHVD